MNTSTNPTIINVKEDDDHDHEDVDELPGFRFHPTDEELVGFYLRRKVDKKSFSIELIKQVDIYKFDPWDLPKTSTSPDKEGYFFCKRGRKYRNSIRPNRVTGSGFWKATGIDKPVYSHGGEGQDCIGLKKTLVYYRGSAGKGTKTDWMMHEFRLPTSNDNHHHGHGSKNSNVKINLQEAEVWTICRIFKRATTQRRIYTQEWRSSSSSNQSKPNSTTTLQQSSITSNASTTTNLVQQNEGYISFEAPIPHHHHHHHHHHHNIPKRPSPNHYSPQHINQTVRNIPTLVTSIDQRLTVSGNTIVHIPPSQPPLSMVSSSSVFNNPFENDQQLFGYDQNWDELRSVVDRFSFDPTTLLDR